MGEREGFNEWIAHKRYCDNTALLIVYDEIVMGLWTIITSQWGSCCDFDLSLPPISIFNQLPNKPAVIIIERSLMSAYNSYTPFIWMILLFLSSFNY